MIFAFGLLIPVLGYGIGYIFIYRKADVDNSEEQARSGRSERRIDIVIPVRNESELLGKKLGNLASQSYPQHLTHVIVIDSAVDNQSEEVVREFSSKHPDLNIDFVKDTVRKGKANALNEAFRRCTGEICIITDVDVLLGEQAISNLVYKFQDPQVGAVSGIEVLLRSGRILDDVAAYRNFYNKLRIAESQIDSVLMCESELSAYRRDLLTDISEATQCDDMQLALNVRLRGYRAIYDPDTSFYESEGANRREMLSQKVRRARANIHELLRNAHLVFSSRLGRFSRVVLPFEIFLNIVAPVSLFISVVAYLLTLTDPAARILSTTLLCALALSTVAASGFLNARPTSMAGFLRNLKDGATFLFSFIEFNITLVVALVLVLTRGPQTSWNPILRGVEGRADWAT